MTRTTHAEPRPRGGALRTILRNIASNAVGYVVNTLVALWLSPILVRSLGDDMYGVWTLLVSLTGHYGLLDLGVRSAVGHYVAVYWSRRDLDGVNRTMNTALVLTWAAALLGLLATAVLIAVLPHWKPAVVAAEPHTWLAILVLGVGVSLSFPMALFSTVLYAQQRLDLQNLIGVTQKLLTAGMILYALHGQHGVVGVAVAVTVGNLLGWSANFLVARRLMPGLRFAPRLFQRRSVREIADYGFFNFIVNAADSILVNTDVVVIGVFMAGTSAITWYSIGANLIPYYMSIVFAVTWAFTPYATALFATGDREGLRRLTLAGTRGALLLGSLIGGGLMLVGHDFLAVWMDPAYLRGTPYASSALVLAILAAATLLRASQSVGRQVLFATQEVRFLGLLACGEAVANLALSCWLVQDLGLVGVALGTLIPILITQGLIQPIYLMRRLELPVTLFAGQILRILVSVLGTMDLVYWLFARHLPVDGWGSLGLKILVLGAPSLAVGVVVGLGREEHQWLRDKLRRREPATQQ